jgi:hypothetical protein
MACVGCQSELRYEEEISVDLAEIKVHFPLFVAKHAIFYSSFQELLGRRSIIVGPDAHKHQESALDRCDDDPVYLDFGLEDALQEGDHAVLGPQFPLSSKFIRSGK